MVLDIRDLGGDGLVFNERLSLADVAREHPDIMETPTLTVSGEVHPGPKARTPTEGARLTGEIRGSLRLRCSRCLEEIDMDRRIVFELTLVSHSAGTADPDHQIDPRETRFFEIEAGKLDLDALIAEQIDLDLPAKPICKPDCAGLCPTCGSNRNRLKCGCLEQTIDPRLTALQAIRDKMGE